MDTELLKKAHERVPSVPVLVNLISKRVKQLINGDKPLVRPLSSDEDKVDTALREVAEGKLISEIDFDAIARAEDWQLHYFRRNAWSNALSSAEDAENAEEHTSLPDGVRLRLLLAPGQAVSGEVTVDWVRPSFSGT